MAVSVGWSGAEWECLRELWYAESRWNHEAVNPESGAAGIPQAIKIPNDKFMSDPQVQISWGIKYIQNRYGTPCEAWKFHQRNGWY